MVLVWLDIYIINITKLYLSNVINHVSFSVLAERKPGAKSMAYY